MRVRIEKPLPQSVVFTKANEAEGFAARIVASLLTLMFQILACPDKSVEGGILAAIANDL